MSVCIPFLMTFALLFPSGMMGPAASSVEHSRHDVLSDAEDSDSDTPTEIEIEEPELFCSGGLRFESVAFSMCRVVLLSRDHVATADLDSSGCRPPPIAS